MLNVDFAFGFAFVLDVVCYFDVVLDLLFSFCGFVFVSVFGFTFDSDGVFHLVVYIVAVFVYDVYVVRYLFLLIA